MTKELTHGLTLRIDADAGDVLIIPTLRLTPPQALQLAGLLDKYAFRAQPKPTPGTLPAAPGRRRKKPHARP